MTKKFLTICCLLSLAIRAVGQEPLTIVFIPEGALVALKTNNTARTTLCSSLALLCAGSTNKMLSTPDTNNWLACSYLSITGRAFAVADRQTENRMTDSLLADSWRAFLVKRGGMIWTNRLLWFDSGLVPDWASATNLATK